jgi:hypothetical protein
MVGDWRKKEAFAIAVLLLSILLALLLLLLPMVPVLLWTIVVGTKSQR